MAKNLSQIPNIWMQEVELNGADVRTVAESDVIGGIPLLFVIPVPDAATGNINVTMTEQVRVIDVWAVKTGGAGGAANTVQVLSTASAISDALDINIADTTVARANLINDANHLIPAAGVLRVTRTKAGGNAACIVYVLAVKM